MKKCFFQKHDFLQIGKVFVCDDDKSYRIEIGPRVEELERGRLWAGGY